MDKHSEDTEKTEIRPGVFVPYSFKRLFYTRSNSSRISKNILRQEARIEFLRDFIKENSGKVLTISDFEKALGSARAGYYLRALIEQGNVVRKRIPTGKVSVYYTYIWVEDDKSSESAPSTPAITQNSTLTSEEYTKVSKLVDKYYTENPNNLPREGLIGLILFKQWIN